MSFFNFAIKAALGGAQVAARKSMSNQKPKQKGSTCTPCAANAYVQRVKAEAVQRRGGR